MIRALKALFAMPLFIRYVLMAVAVFPQPGLKKKPKPGKSAARETANF